jgi:hypothetical protein
MHIISSLNKVIARPPKNLLEYVIARPPKAAAAISNAKEVKTIVKRRLFMKRVSGSMKG